MLLNLLESNVSGNGNATQTYIIIAVFALVLIGYMVLSSRQRKKQADEAEQKLKSIAVGDTILTIGMISGEIVEVIDDGAYYVIKTGSEENFGFLKIDARAIYQIYKPEDLLKAQEETAETSNQDDLPTELPEQIQEDVNAEEKEPVFEELTTNEEKAETEEVKAEENQVEEVKAEEDKKDE